MHGLPSTTQIQSTLHITTLDYMTQISPSTKHSSVNLPSYYNYDIYDTIFFRADLFYNRGHYVHKWWDRHIFPISYVTSNLEHVGESWWLFQALGNMGERCEHWRTLGKVVSIFLQYIFFSSSLCIQNGILHWYRPFSCKTSMEWHLRP